MRVIMHVPARIVKLNDLFKLFNENYSTNNLNSKYIMFTKEV